MPQLLLDRFHRVAHPLVACNVVARGEDGRVADVAHDLAGSGLDQRHPLDRVAEQLDAKDRLFVRGMDLDRVAAHAECAAREGEVVPAVLHADEAPLDEVHRNVYSAHEPQEVAFVLLGRPQAVDAGHARDDQYIFALQERRGRRVPQPVDLVIHRGVFLDVGIRRRDVRLRLVVVVVADEVLDGVLREELPELVRELGGEGLVRRDDEGRPLDALDQPRDRRRLSRARDAEQRLEIEALLYPVRERVDRPRLVAGRTELRRDAEGRHAFILTVA